MKRCSTPCGKKVHIKSTLRELSFLAGMINDTATLKTTEAFTYHIAH